MKEHGDKLDATTTADVTTALEEAKKVNSEADLETLKEKVTALSNASMKIGQAIYAKKSETTEGGEKKEETPTATDAEFEEKDKKKESNSAK